MGAERERFDAENGIFSAMTVALIGWALTLMVAWMVGRELKTLRERADALEKRAEAKPEGVR